MSSLRYRFQSRDLTWGKVISGYCLGLAALAIIYVTGSVMRGSGLSVWPLTIAIGISLLAFGWYVSSRRRRRA